MTVELLRPVPMTPMRAEARVARPGRSVELIEATLNSDRGPVLKATAWRLRRTELDVPAEALPTGTQPRPDTLTPGPEHDFFPTGQSVGFHTGVEYRFVSGGFRTLGPAICWFRLRFPIVAGTSPSPLERTLASADFGNGISCVLPWDQYLFINTDLTVTLHREPVGEWVCLDAVTYPDRSGIGMAESRLFDQQGPIGRSSQTLLLDKR